MPGILNRKILASMTKNTKFKLLVLKRGPSLSHFLLPVFLGFMVLLAFACQDKDYSPSEMFYEYFPDSPGHYVIYDVDSLVYDDFSGEVLNFNYQVKEVIESRFIDSEGLESLRLERFKRQSPADNWQVKNIWQARLLPSRAEKTEENITYIKLVFPPKEGQTWNGNAYNTLPSQTYRITDAHKPYLIAPGLAFDSTVSVVQRNFFTVISEDLQEEKYAKHVGLIYKRYRKVTKQVDGTITSGVDYSYRIISYGKE
jgi:hypothetical protein